MAFVLVVLFGETADHHDVPVGADRHVADERYACSHGLVLPQRAPIVVDTDDIQVGVRLGDAPVVRCEHCAASGHGACGVEVRRTCYFGVGISCRRERRAVTIDAPTPSAAACIAGQQEPVAF